MAKETNAYYFRGTTLGYHGNKGHQVLPCTPTTRNPGKAIAFAKQVRSYGIPVIYIIKTTALTMVAKAPKGVFPIQEEEVGFKIKPADFTKLCDGYISYNEAQEIMREMGIVVDPDFGHFTKWLKKFKPLGDIQIREFYNRAQRFLKK